MNNLRCIAAASVQFGPGLNVLVGRNAQGKTTVLEAVGLLARGRSFRTERLQHVVRRGVASGSAEGLAVEQHNEQHLRVSIEAGRRTLAIAGHEVAAREYQGHLEAAVYCTDRLAVVRGARRERRQFFDRSAAAIWPSYRRLLSDYGRVVEQRNAGLRQGLRALEPWDERLLELGSELRHRRSEYIARLQRQLDSGSHVGERYTVRSEGWPLAGIRSQREHLESQLRRLRERERSLGTSLAGPHRDQIEMLVDGLEAASTASAGQQRSLVLALTEAVLAVHRQERGQAAVALLDDLDSDLDEQRSRDACARLAALGQVIVSTAHERWGREVGSGGRVFEVSGGDVRAN